MFTPKTFVLCSRFELFKAHANLWIYWTADTLQECLAENYFRPRQNLKNHDSPEVGDVIQCVVENHYLAYLVVTAKTEAPYHITVQQTFLSEVVAHDSLYNRDLANQHPITAITGLLERLNNLEGRGRFLSDWDAETGLPATNPDENPYPYKAGDYYIVNNVSETTNYRPDGEEYVHDVPSVTVETSDVAVNDTYMYDGTVWILRKDSEPKIPVDAALSLISENPVQNKVITAALNTKQNVLTAGTNISIVGTTISSTYEYVLTKQKILTALGYTPYDSTNPDGFISGITSSDVISALGYTPYSTSNPAGYITSYTVTQTDVTTALGYTPVTPTQLGEKQDIIEDLDDIRSGAELGASAVQPDDLATVATTGSYDDLSDKPTIPTVSVSATGTAVDEVQYITIDGVEKKLAGGSGGSGRNVGDIFYTSRTDTTLAGAVECNGATYSTTDFSGSGAIGALLIAGKVPYISLSQYASDLAAHGSVRAFGWDGGSSTAFRVPTLSNVFLEAGQAASAGEYISAGLPNITGEFANRGRDGSYSGAFYKVKSSGSNVAGGSLAQDTVGFNASLSSSVYGNSTTVQPNAVKYRAMVQLANGATDEALETCTGVLATVGTHTTQINTLNAHRVIDFQEPTAENGYTWYRKYADGWVEQGGVLKINNNWETVTIPVEMSNNNYCIYLQVTDGTENATTCGLKVSANTVTTTTFKCSSSYNDQTYLKPKIYWRVSGVAA